MKSFSNTYTRNAYYYVIINERNVVSFEKQCKVHRNPKPNNNIIITHRQQFAKCCFRRNRFS